MAYVMTDKEFTNKLIDICKNYKTLYIMGCFGAPMNDKGKKRYTKNHSYNKDEKRTAMIMAADENTFGFDCVCLLKGVLWGWNGDNTRTYGGSNYASNGVPDIGADSFITKCSEVSTENWDTIVPGEAVWVKGHIGVYVGDGLVVECTPAWKNCVQLTALSNIGAKSGYPKRKWTKHGKIPWIEYTKKEEVANEETYTVTKDVSSKYKSCVTTCNLNFRVDPSTYSRIICVMPKGGTFVTDGCTVVVGSITWAHGCYETKNGKVYGWAAKKYLKEA